MLPKQCPQSIDHCLHPGGFTVRKLLSTLIVVAAFAAPLTLHADPISGFFSATGTDSFTSSTITFYSAQVAGDIGGTFATYLTDGNTISFLPGALPYNNGPNTPPNPPFTTGTVPLFTTSEGGETFTFNMSNYDAGYITDGSNGCTSGSTCLDVTGNGFFTATGPTSGTSGPAVFSFTSQYVSGQPLASITTFSASTSAVPPAVPEPSTLALLGTGVLAMAGLVRRRMSGDTA
jgi:hypothetical protein